MKKKKKYLSKSVAVTAKQAQHDGRLMCSGEFPRFKEGDWIVEYECGLTIIVRDEDFRDLYEKDNNN